MTTFAKTSTTRLRTFAALPVALLSAMLFVACGSGPQAALPFAPSALPSSTLALEAPEGIDAWGTLGKGNDKEQGDKGKNDKGKGKDDADLDVDVDVDVDVDEDAGGLWEGTVSSLSLPATCPAITFVVATRTVVTDAATKFQGGTCLQVLNDVNVRVRGTLQTNGTVLASRVKMGTDDDEVENPVDDEEDGTPHHGEGPHDGTVSSFRGVCPTVTFNLKGLTIVADGTTAYVGGDCATLRPNVQVVVTGALAPTAPRTFNAATITITRAH